MIAECLALAFHLSGLSYHAGSRDYNEVNTGAGVSCEYEQGRRWSADWYRDSLDEPSGYIAHEWDAWQGGRFSAGVMAGVMHRNDVQREYGLAAFPFALPYATIGQGAVRLRVYAVPAVTEKMDSFAAAQLRLRF